MPRVLLPIGISFFTFHAISYVVDVYRRDATAQKSPVHAALYLLLFPQLIAGPIIRYRDIADQLARRVVTLDDFAYGVRRFVIGLAKKVLIANIVAGPADKIFGMPSASCRPAHAWLGIVCYTLQIYFDFSGYSDMAIGLGRMFGFRFPENFRWPYIADTVQEFWRRWHISLSTWFRDYLYMPLGGNRVSPGAHVSQPRHGVLPVRPVARRELELRRSGACFTARSSWSNASVAAVADSPMPDPQSADPGAGLADLAARLHAARRDGRLGVLPRRDAARRGRVPEGDGRADGRRADAVHGAVVSDARVWLALVAGAIGSTPLVPALAARLSGLGRRSDGRAGVERRPAEHGDADGAARRVDHAGGGAHLQPVHLFPILMRQRDAR